MADFVLPLAPATLHPLSSLRPETKTCRHAMTISLFHGLYGQAMTNRFQFSPYDLRPTIISDMANVWPCPCIFQNNKNRWQICNSAVPSQLIILTQQHNDNKIRNAYALSPLRSYQRATSLSAADISHADHIFATDDGDRVERGASGLNHRRHLVYQLRVSIHRVAESTVHRHHRMLGEYQAEEGRWRPRMWVSFHGYH